MSELRTLLTLELRALGGFNKIRYTKDRKARHRYRLLAVAMAILVALLLTYVGGLVYGLCMLGLAEMVPAYLSTVASLLILVLGFFTAGRQIFGQKGYDILASMPLRAPSIVLSRFAVMYLADLGLTLAVMLPGMAVYGICARPAWWFYPIMLLGTLLLPAIPLVLAILLGTLILAVSSRMKHKSLVQSVLMILLVVGGLAGSLHMGASSEGASIEQLTELAGTVGGVIETVYPPAGWLGEAALRLDWMRLGVFLLVSAALLVGMALITSGCFHGIVRRLGRHNARHDYTLGTLASRSLLRALYLREAKRYLSSPVYVTNTIVGPLMGAIMAIALCVTGIDTIEGALPIPVDVAGLWPFVLSAVFSMMTTTSCSISMEGRQFWVVKSLPIPTKLWLDSKLLLNLSLIAPFYLVAAVAMVIARRPTPLELLWLLLIPASVIVFAVVLGISINLKLHSFDWEKEETVVKQSLPAMLGGFAGFFLSAALGVIVCVLPEAFGTVTRLVMCLLLWVGAGCLYRMNIRRSLAELS